MITKEFEALVERRVGLIQSILTKKAKEYSSEDRLYNFKRAAEILRCTPHQALMGMFMKHMVSIMDLVEGRLDLTEAMIDEKIGDGINYFILLEAVLKELLPKIQRTKG